MIQNIQQFRSYRRRSPESGSALLIAVLFSFIMMTLLAGYFKMAFTELRISSRSFLLNANFNLAEGGVELAIDALNRGDSSGWTTGTDGSGDTYWARNYGTYDLGDSFEGQVNVVIIDPTSANPRIHSEGLTEDASGSVIRRQIYVELESGFYPFKNGFDSQTDVIFSGADLTLDSYDSSLGAYDSFLNRSSEITLAAPLVDESGNQADIYGYVVTGASAPNVGPNGSITTYSNPNVVDTSRVTNDYYQSFPNISQPSFTSPSGTLLTNGTWTNGDYEINSSWSSAGNNAIDVTGDVRVFIDGDMALSGNATITIQPGASLEIYVSGDVNLGGNGILNSGVLPRPEDFLVFGTEEDPGDQDISITGNGALHAAVYAPNANVTLDGNGRVFGAVAAYDVSLTGNTYFSFDTSLEDFQLGTAGYEPSEWMEIVNVAVSPNAVDMGDYGL